MIIIRLETILKFLIKHLMDKIQELSAIQWIKSRAVRSQNYELAAHLRDAERSLRETDDYNQKNLWDYNISDLTTEKLESIKSVTENLPNYMHYSCTFLKEVNSELTIKRRNDKLDSIL